MLDAFNKLLSLRSRLADGVVAFCAAALERLDDTGFCCQGADGQRVPVRISATAVDARVFTLEKAPEEDKDRGRGPGHEQESRREATVYEKELAELNETPAAALNRKAVKWS